MSQVVLWRSQQLQICFSCEGHIGLVSEGIYCSIYKKGKYYYITLAFPLFLDEVVKALALIQLE
jgi:hypothetical protein